MRGLEDTDGLERRALLAAASGRSGDLRRGGRPRLDRLWPPRRPRRALRARRLDRRTRSCTPKRTTNRELRSSGSRSRELTDDRERLRRLPSSRPKPSRPDRRSKEARMIGIPYISRPFARGLAVAAATAALAAP